MRATKWTKEYTETLAKKSVSVTEMIRNGGCNVSGGMHRHVKRCLAMYNIDTSHFSGALWSKGKTYATDHRIIVKSNDEVFILNGTSTSQTVRKKFKLISPYCCTSCELSDTWNGNYLTLQLDHIDGNHSNNTVENLRWLCPNCHSQTSTYCNGSLKEKIPKVKNVVEKIPKVKKERKTKIQWPDPDELYAQVLSSSFEKVAHGLGVSGNAVKKHLQKNGKIVPRYHTQNFNYSNTM
jgi:5-methylcytosine-specific restriction endonuclease McrA